MLLETVERLLDCGHTVPLVATCPAGPESEATPEDFKRLARRIGAAFAEVRSLDAPAMVQQLVAAAADVAVSVNWLTRIGPEARAAFSHGILNAHGGDLPRYRGIEQKRLGDAADSDARLQRLQSLPQ